MTGTKTTRLAKMIHDEMLTLHAQQEALEREINETIQRKIEAVGAQFGNEAGLQYAAEIQADMAQHAHWLTICVRSLFVSSLVMQADRYPADYDRALILEAALNVLQGQEQKPALSIVRSS